MGHDDSRARLPAIEELLRLSAERGLLEAHGRARVVTALRAVVADLRQALRKGTEPDVEAGAVLERACARLVAERRPSLRPALNLTGTVLHTNLGRAPLPDEAIAEVVAVAQGASTLEYDIEAGERGERDDHTETLLCELTGAAAATVVNNNAAAVLLVLNTLALRREVLVSRGELVEIGGSFRIPEIMARAGAKLREVGTTNRTHQSDFRAAVTARTALVMKVHPSNYRIEGFAAAVREAELARIAEEAGLPFVVDLGSGSLLDLSRWGIPPEPTVRDTLAAGADLVTFSGDKLLGGPQAGLIVGRRDLVAKLRRNPLRRALRCDKMTIAALGAVLRLHKDADRLPERLPTLRLLTRPLHEVSAAAEKLMPALQSALDGWARVEICSCHSQIGSGALPCATLPSMGLRITPVRRPGAGRSSATRIAAALRRLPIPVIGRLENGSVVLDLRCLGEEATFAAQLAELPGQLRKAAESPSA